MYLNNGEIQKALDFLKLAGERGSVDAAFNLGVMYLDGHEGVERDSKEAARFVGLLMPLPSAMRQRGTSI